MPNRSRIVVFACLRRKSFFVVFAAFAFFLSPSRSSAQPSRRIVGRVTDETGGALPRHGRAAIARHLRASVEVFNLFDDAVSDIDYYFASRLPGEPLDCVNDIHSHPAVPRTVRVGLGLSF